MKLGTSAANRSVVYARDGLGAGTHKVTITRASGRIDLDGIVVLR